MSNLPPPKVEIPTRVQQNYQRMREAVFAAESSYAPFLSNPLAMDVSTAASVAAEADARRTFQAGETIAKIRDALPC